MDLSNKSDKEKLLYALSWIDQALEQLRPRHVSLSGLGGFLRNAANKSGVIEEDVEGTCGPLRDTLRILMSKQSGAGNEMWDKISSMFNLPDNGVLNGLRNEYAYCILYSLLITDYLMNLTAAGYVLSEPVEIKGER